MDTNKNSNHLESQQENKPKGGNMSTTALKDGVFIKYIPVDKFDYRIGVFQSRLFYNIKNLSKNFKIVDTLAYKKNVTGDFYEIHYEVVNEKQWELKKESAAIIGENMAKIHNHCYAIREFVDLPKKDADYNNMSEWEKINNQHIVNSRHYFIRRDIFKDIKRLDTKQVKIPLHRDFRKHNILWDGERYVLIDFDFAAHDFVSIEIAAFISDMLDDEKEDSGLLLVEEFLKNYIKHSEIEGIIWQNVISDYLNYLCVNTFPVYLKDKIDSVNFDELLKQRTETLIKIYKHNQAIDLLVSKLIKNK